MNEATASDIAERDDEIEPDVEDAKVPLRAWLRLLTCTTMIENEIRSRLRVQFNFTLPRFDLLAQLDKSEDGLVLGEASKRLMVSAGNITAIVEKLLESGYITRNSAPHDKRIQIIRLTHAGRTAFHIMAAVHNTWINDLFGRLSSEDIAILTASLGQLKTSVQLTLEEAEQIRAPALPVDQPKRRGKSTE